MQVPWQKQGRREGGRLTIDLYVPFLFCNFSEDLIGRAKDSANQKLCKFLDLEIDYVCNEEWLWNKSSSLGTLIFVFSFHELKIVHFVYLAESDLFIKHSIAMVKFKRTLH